MLLKWFSAVHHIITRKLYIMHFIPLVNKTRPFYTTIDDTIWWFYLVKALAYKFNSSQGPLFASNGQKLNRFADITLNSTSSTTKQITNVVSVCYYNIDHIHHIIHLALCCFAILTYRTITITTHSARPIKILGSVQIMSI